MTWHTAEYEESLTGQGDAWWHPRTDKLNQGVEVPGEAPGLNPQGWPPKNPCYCDVGLEQPHEWCGTCENGKRPTTQREATASTKFVYLEGKVALGDEWWELGRQLAEELGLTWTQQNYISNLIARNALPHDFDMAVGSVRNGRPQIWASNADRNAVWDAVKSALPQEEEEEYPPFDPSEWL